MPDQLLLPGTTPRVQCVRRGTKIRVRVLHGAKEIGWWVAFPKKLREEGAIYQVGRLVPVRDRYYRAAGPYRRIAEDPSPAGRDLP